MQACYIESMPRRTNQPDADDPLRDSARGVRLQKALAEMGIASRRACEQMIEDGRVAVNGRTMTDLPVWVNVGEDRIEVDGRTVGRRRRGHRYLLVNKPRNVICTNDDPQGRRRVIDLVPVKDRLFCVGRLDFDSTGLVLLTDDGALTQKLTHPSRGVAKTYDVTIKGRLDEEEVDKLSKGIWLSDKRAGGGTKAKAASVKLVRRDRDRSRVQVTLTEGKNREIRRMLARLGHPVKKLKRIAIGPVRLKGVASGEWRELTRQEVAALRRAVRGRPAPAGRRKKR